MTAAKSVKPLAARHSWSHCLHQDDGRQCPDCEERERERAALRLMFHEVPALFVVLNTAAAQMAERMKA